MDVCHAGTDKMDDGSCVRRLRRQQRVVTWRQCAGLLRRLYRARSLYTE